MLNPTLNQIDPMKKQPDRGSESKELSPMDPPEAYAPPGADVVSPAEMHPYLRKFVEEHVPFLKEVLTFEETILTIQKEGYTKELDRKLRHFFHVFDEVFIPHSHEEEASFFPLLERRLIEKGEHSKGAETLNTPVTVMLDDHLKAAQLAAVILNFLGLAFRLPDDRSRLIVLDSALEQGKELVELLRLHIFREDNILFSLAHHLITVEEFDRMESIGAARK